jgi:hypothetical protein
MADIVSEERPRDRVRGDTQTARVPRALGELVTPRTEGGSTVLRLPVLDTISVGLPSPPVAIVLRPPRCVRPLALGALLVAAACYRSVPVDPAPLPAGADVRLYLTGDGTAQLAPRLGPQTVAVDGRVDGVGADGVTVVVSRTTKQFGDKVAWVGERVTIPTGVIARAEHRVLDRRRTFTAAASAAGIALAAMVALLAAHGNGAGSQNPGDGPAPTP